MSNDSQMIAGRVIDCDPEPKAAKDWTVHWHNNIGKIAWQVERVQLLIFDSQPKPGVSFDEYSTVESGIQVAHQLDGLITLNANVLEYLLVHPELIPETWKGRYVFFWGTIYLSRAVNPIRGVMYPDLTENAACIDGRHLAVRYLSYRNDSWHSGWCWIRSTWYDNYAAAVYS
jgi:hypothetical protein